MSGLEMTILPRVYLMPETVLVIWHLLSHVLQHSWRKGHFIPILQIRKLTTNKLIWLYSYSSPLDSFLKKYLILAVLGPHCYAWTLQLQRVGASHGSGFLRAEYGLWAQGSAVLHAGCCSAFVAVRGLSCPTACGILPGQGLNPCPLHWQSDS